MQLTNCALHIYFDIQWKLEIKCRCSSISIWAHVQSSQLWFFFTAKGGRLFFVNTMVPLTYWPLSPRLSTAQQLLTTKPRGLTCRICTMTLVPWSFCWSLCLLVLLLALRIHTAHSAPDFSRKCSAFHINNWFYWRKSKCWPFAFQFCKRMLDKDIQHSLIYLHILLSKQLVQLMLKNQNQGEEAAEQVLNLDLHRTGLDTPTVINKLQPSCV